MIRPKPRYTIRLWGWTILIYRWRVEEEFIGAIRGQEQIRRTSFVDAVNYMDFTEAVPESTHVSEVSMSSSRTSPALALSAAETQ